MDFITASETAAKWGISKRRVTTLCANGRVPGAQKVGQFWVVPRDVEKPTDDRFKAGKKIAISEKTYNENGK